MVKGDRRGQLVGAGLAALWFVVVLITELSTGKPAFVPSILFALGPLIACAVLEPVPTAGFGVAAVGLVGLTSVWNGTWGTAQMWLRVADVGLVSLAAVTLAVVRVRRETQLERMVRIAEVAQRAMLPLVPTHVGTVAAGARYLSAAEDALVGGDLYDWFHSDHRVCFIVGDVRGKGVGAVEQAARVIRAFRQSAAGSGDLATVAAEMSAYIDPFLDDEEFVTALLLQVTDRGHVTLVNCGHPHPLLITCHDGASLVDLPSGLPLGLGRSFEEVTVPWTPGDRMLLYTDGLSEARDARGEFLPVLPLAPLLRRPTVEDALDGVLGAVREHVPGGRFTDDLAVLLLENVDGDEAHAVDPRDYRVGRVHSQSIDATPPGPTPLERTPAAAAPNEPATVEPGAASAAGSVR